MPEPGPWNDESLDEWRCPDCCSMHYTPKDTAITMQCPYCDEHPLMERLYPL